ncbi:MAG: SDR family oxidoreductase [Sphingobacteriia bacterium]|nr:MAG: SDR family oxidoreductase [Sphingobacteriia bacterium]
MGLFISPATANEPVSQECFSGKVIVVTGGSEGIGKAMVEFFLTAGAKVATCGRNHDKLYALQAAHSGMPLVIHVADVSKEMECQLFIEKVVQQFGGIDVLINNAGISMRSLFQDLQLETLRKVMDINFWGMVYCSKFALPHLQKTSGSIVGVSSIAGYRGLPGRTGYSASKFAMNGFLEALRTELLDEGVNVLWVCPGFTASNIRQVALDQNAQPQGESPMDESSMMSAQLCAQHIARSIRKRQRTLVLTFNGHRTVWLNKWLPQLTDRLVRNFFFKNGRLAK